MPPDAPPSPPRSPLRTTSGRARAMLAVFALALMCWWPLPAVASDYLRECRALDGDEKHELDLEANELRRTKGGPLVPFKMVERQRLRQVTGYCNTKGGRFKFNTEIFGLTVEFSEQGKTVKQKFRCEMSEDATPAGLNCDTEVRTIDFKAPQKLREAYQ